MCKQITCLNGGKCDQVLGSYKCTCLPGWTGQYCGTSMKYYMCPPVDLLSKYLFAIISMYIL